jgi:putative DNA primase/helicase
MTCPSDLRAIARALGGEVVGRQVLAPGPGHSRQDRSLSVTISATAPEGFLAFSHAGDDFAQCRDHVKAALGIERRSFQPAPRRPTQPSRDDDRIARARAYARQIVSEIVPIVGTPGETYLRDVRRIDTSAIADVLERTDAIGWHPAVYFSEPCHPLDRQRLACLVGVMTDAVTAGPTGAISRTYIGPDGKKVGKAKTLASPMGLVRLTPDDEVLGGLCISEGLESALAGMSLDLRPMWSTGSTALMAKFPVLAAIEALNIFADHDANGAGEKAAREAESRWRAAGREVNLYQTGELGDLNTLLKGS